MKPLTEMGDPKTLPVRMLIVGIMIGSFLGALGAILAVKEELDASRNTSG